MEKTQAVIVTPNNEWLQYFIEWFQAQLLEHYNDSDQCGVVIIKEDHIEIRLYDLIAR